MATLGTDDGSAIRTDLPSDDARETRRALRVRTWTVSRDVLAPLEQGASFEERCEQMERLRCDAAARRGIPYTGARKSLEQRRSWPIERIR